MAATGQDKFRPEPQAGIPPYRPFFGGSWLQALSPSIYQTPQSHHLAYTVVDHSDQALTLSPLSQPT